MQDVGNDDNVKAPRIPFDGYRVKIRTGCFLHFLEGQEVQKAEYDEKSCEKYSTKMITNGHFSVEYDILNCADACQLLAQDVKEVTAMEGRRTESSKSRFSSLREGTTVHLSISRELRQKLEDVAVRDQVSISAAARQLLAVGLEKGEKGKERV